MSGGYIQADSDNFAFLIQHFKDAKERNLYLPQGYLDLTVNCI
jgi:hypothetical protein